jgi:hypothetical protein
MLKVKDELPFSLLRVICAWRVRNVFSNDLYLFLTWEFGGILREINVF